MNKMNLMLLLYFIFILFCCLPLFAQYGTSDSLTNERIRCIQKTLNKDRLDIKKWRYGWLYGYGVATIAQGTISSLSEINETKQDMAIGAITSALGVAGMFLSPIKLRSGNIAESLECCPTDNHEDRIIKLNHAEELLKRTAFMEKEAKSWRIHAICGVVNIGSGLVTWLGFKRTLWDGVETFAINTAITEFQIWTSPSRALRDYRDYCNKYIDGGNLYNKPSKLNWTVGFSLNSIHLKLVF